MARPWVLDNEPIPLISDSATKGSAVICSNNTKACEAVSVPGKGAEVKEPMTKPNPIQIRILLANVNELNQLSFCKKRFDVKCMY